MTGVGLTERVTVRDERRKRRKLKAAAARSNSYTTRNPLCLRVLSTLSPADGEDLTKFEAAGLSRGHSVIAQTIP